MVKILPSPTTGAEASWPELLLPSPMLTRQAWPSDAPSATWPIDLAALPPDCAHSALGCGRRQGDGDSGQGRIDLEHGLAREHGDALADGRRHVLLLVAAEAEGAAAAEQAGRGEGDHDTLHRLPS